MSNIPAGFCLCGCGQRTAVASKTDYRRGAVKGLPMNYVESHNSRITRRSYVRHRINGESVQEHVAVATRALGKPLPRGAEVHHVDENKRNNAGRNLVVCQDRSYHQLLHVRARVVRAGGNPNTQRICSRCRLLKSFGEFSKCGANKSGGLNRTCRACQAEYRKTYIRPSQRAQQEAM